MSSFYTTLNIGFPFGNLERNKFKYCGVNYNKEPDHAVHEMIFYEEQLQEIAVTKDRKTRPISVLTESEMTMCRELLGKLSWLALRNRPDVCYMVNKAAQELGTVQCMLTLNKVVRAIKRATIVEGPTALNFQKFSKTSPKELVVLAFSE